MFARNINYGIKLRFTWCRRTLWLTKRKNKFYRTFLFTSRH